MEITTAEELAQMTPEQRQAQFEASIVWNLDDVPAEYLARVRERFSERLAERAEGHVRDAFDPR